MERTIKKYYKEGIIIEYSLVGKGALVDIIKIY